jgi:hypothetical protein
MMEKLKGRQFPYGLISVLLGLAGGTVFLGLAYVAPVILARTDDAAAVKTLIYAFVAINAVMFIVGGICAFLSWFKEGAEIWWTAAGGFINVMGFFCLIALL